MTPFQVLVWLAAKHATFNSKNGEFSIEANGLYFAFKIPTDEQIPLTSEQLVKHLAGCCTTIQRALDGPTKELPDGVKSTDVT